MKRSHDDTSSKSLDKARIRSFQIAVTMAQPRVHLGSHSSANRFASAICAGVILAATSLRSLTAMESDGARETARLSHIRAMTAFLGTP